MSHPPVSSLPANDEDDDMKLPAASAARTSTLVANLTSILSRIQRTTTTHSIRKPIRLVAVSKLKPATDILALHTAPSPQSQQLHFGENYVQELLEKSKLLPGSVRWHFIGGLQSNKCAQLAREVPGLWAVESVDSVKKAGLLDKGRGEGNEKNKKQKRKKSGEENDEGGDTEPLRVFVQVNTSGEESKSGVDPVGEELVKLCRYIREECKNLRLQGLMTIGAIARSQATTVENENEDFTCLRETRDNVATELGMKPEELELSMGMSEDFEGAIAMGSDEVRVGSIIFGERPAKKDAKVLEDTEKEVKK